MIVGATDEGVKRESIIRDACISMKVTAKPKSERLLKGSRKYRTCGSSYVGEVHVTILELLQIGSGKVLEIF